MTAGGGVLGGEGWVLLRFLVRFLIGNFDGKFCQNPDYMTNRRCWNAGNSSVWNVERVVVRLKTGLTSPWRMTIVPAYMMKS